MKRLQIIAVILLVGQTNASIHAQKNEKLSYRDLQSRPLYNSLRQTLGHLSQAETAREEASLAGKHDEELEPNRRQCRAVISETRVLQTQMAQLLTQAYGRRPSQRKENSWTVRELESLGRNLKVQLSRAYRNQALCYPPGSADRINALNLALEQLPDVVSQPLNEPSVWRARVEQVVCLRLAKKNTLATKLVEHWLRASPPTNVGKQLDREKTYLEVDAGNLAFALAHEDYELLNYAAAKLYASSKLSESVATYDRIAVLLAAQGRVELQFQALKTAAAIVRRQKKPFEAMSRFRELALQQSKHSEAASVHLIAVGLSAELSREATLAQRSERFENYLALLNEHLQSWPDQPSAIKVKRWLAQTQQLELERERAKTFAAQGDRVQALALYRKLLEDAPNDAHLMEAYAKLLSRSTDQAELREALRAWRRYEKRCKPGGTRWWRCRRARLALLDSLGEGGQAKKLRQLTKILHSENQASPAPKSGEPRPKKTGEPRP